MENFRTGAGTVVLVAIILYICYCASLDSYVAGSATYGLYTSRTGIPDLFFLTPFHSRDRAPPAINSPAIATRLIKRERLVHICVE